MNFIYDRFGCGDIVIYSDIQTEIKSGCWQLIG